MHAAFQPGMRAAEGIDTLTFTPLGTSKRLALLAIVCLPLMPMSPATARASHPTHNGEHATTATGGTISAIRVEGNQRIETSTILSYMVVAPGEPFDQAELDRSLKTLYATGLFHDVSLSREGGTLIVHVIENPIVNRIVFEGNHALTDDKLRDVLSLRTRAVFTTDMAQRDREKLLELYAASGRFAVTVQPQIIRLADNRVDVIFNIKENNLTLISRISFVGNHAFGEGKLRSVITTEETAWYKFFSTNDEYNPERLNFDKELLRRFYLRNGYIDFNVVDATAELSPDRKSFYITFTVSEGARYRVGSVKITSDIRGAVPEIVRPYLEVRRGQWYDGDEVQRDADNMQALLQTKGFPFAEVKPQIGRDEANHIVDLVFPLENGPRVYVDRIEINGNTRTEDRVIRREFSFAEGDPFTENQVRRTKQSLTDLGYFQTVDIDQSPGSAPDRTIVNANLSEKATGQLTLGGGYSTDAGALANAGIEQKNFIGTGIDASINGTLAQYENQIDLSVTDPYFLDRNLVGGIDVYRTANNYAALGYANYDEVREGGTFRIGYAFNNFLSQSWNYTIVNRNVSQINTGSSIYVLDESGRSLLSQVGTTLSLDTRDSRVEPHKGFIIRLGEDVAGLGGNEKYIRSKLDGGYYFPLDYFSGNRDWTLVERAGAGYIADYSGGRQSLIDNFYLGGDTLRGFLDGGVGPHAIPTNAYPSADSLGGRFIYTESTELHFPLPLPPDLGISGRAFVDVGGLSGIRTNAPSSDQLIQPIVGNSLSPRVGAGVGVSWKSPFGLINIDVAAPVAKQREDQTQVFRFGFGTNF